MTTNTNMADHRVALRSNASKKYLRMDGQGVTSFMDNGGGKVNTNNTIGPDETLILERHNDGTVSFKSIVFPNVYLRLDAGNVKKGDKLPDGGGVVNCQFGSRSLEKFKIVKTNSAGIVGIESNQFHGRFLRMNGAKDQVNVQGIMGSDEEWEIVHIA